ncbi:ATPase [Salinisphaera shabanensis T35B1]|uniref:hypothetical protein n=1 Tax=Salinisphaera shabanensis TaxID=180542 RepID=UPI003340A694
MALLALSNQLQPSELSLEQIYLDPNNPRFVEANWDEIPQDQIADGDVQESTRRRMVRQFGVEKLKMNMEVNGYLPIDRVIVKEFEKDKFVVLEGNRRICAAKMISTVAADGSAITPEVSQSLGEIPVLIYTGGDVDAAWIFQGLRHISGVQDWSAFNKAKLLVEQMESESLSLTEVGRRFGLTPHGAGQWVRGFYAFKQAKEESDYIAEVDERSYPYFQELFSRSSATVRDWIEWDDNEKSFKNTMNLNEFVSWLYPRPDSDDEDEHDVAQGDFGERWLARRDDIRDLAYLLREDPELFQQFRTTGRLEEAYSQSLAKQYEKKAQEKADPVGDLFDSLLATNKALDNVPLKVVKDPDLNERLMSLMDNLEEKISFIKN